MRIIIIQSKRQILQIHLISNFEVIEQKNEFKDITLSNIDTVSTAIETTITNIDTNIQEYGLNKTEKDKKIQDITQNLTNLREHKSVSEQKEDLEKWFEYHKEAELLNEKLKSINTKKLTEISKQAHNELLTENLRLKFIEEIEYFSGFSKLDVKLEEAGSSKGKTSTKLMIKKENSITSIFSEGEQKTVALALFIAEIRMQKNNNPIVLDDPVTSLDHKIACDFAERLLKLDNQIILFTHNSLFLSAFESSKRGHRCNTFNTSCNKKNKHIYLYKIESEGKCSKGIITSHIENRAENYINFAKEYLNGSSFNLEDICSKLRKAIECLVDEKILKNITPTRFSSKNNRIL
ncbi:MAG: AAA family ATPase [bacterium]|nr:AAA family ATPase [bacterium]